MFSSLRLARSRSQSSTTSCTGGGDKEQAVNGDPDRHGDRQVDRHVYQVTPGAPACPPRGLSSCPTSPLLSGKPPKTPRSLARRGSSKCKYRCGVKGDGSKDLSGRGAQASLPFHKLLSKAHRKSATLPEKVTSLAYTKNSNQERSASIWRTGNFNSIIYLVAWG